MKRNTLYRIDELAEMPLPTKAEEAAEQAELEESRRHAEKHGDWLLELLRSPECDPRRIAVSSAKASDYEVKGRTAN